MSEQYCQITSWIEHNKKHGDPAFAEAIKDLCLDSYLKKSRRNKGLTFLYPDAKFRKAFCSKVFTAESRGAVEDFKRYILPDVFETCEDFKNKDVGNVLGYSYAVDKVHGNKVTFNNGMEIVPCTDFESLSVNLIDLVKIYIIVEKSGSPPESGDPYKIPYATKQGGLPEHAKQPFELFQR